MVAEAAKGVANGLAKGLVAGTGAFVSAASDSKATACAGLSAVVFIGSPSFVVRKF